jgi:hypothetical protein
MALKSDDPMESGVSMRLLNYWQGRGIAETQTGRFGRKGMVASAFLVAIVTLVCAAFVSSAGRVEDKLRGQDPIRFGDWYGPSPRPVPARLAKLFAASLEREGVECPRSGPTEFAWTEFDLSSDGAKDLIVQPFDACTCSPTGNCDLWIFRNTRSGYSNILTAEGQVQMFRIMIHQTRGFHDIETSMHGSAYDSGVTVWKFNGEYYKEACQYDRSYEYPDKDGTMRVWDKPRITPCR